MNEDKFSGKADFYAKYRPSYPAVIIDTLYEKTHADTVADIGAGTGIFTKCLMAKPWKIIAVEPNPDMYKKLKSSTSDITHIMASAESTGLADNSVSLITAAQAFHWFDEQRFKEECKRILSPGGKLAIIFNERAKTGLSARRDDICMRYCGAFHTGHVGKRDADEGDRFLREEYFSSVELITAKNDILFDKERFIGDTLSRSYAISESDEGYGEFLSELTAAFNEFEQNGIVTMSYNTSCYLGTL